IWMRTPSGVTSSRIWSLNFASDSRSSMPFFSASIRAARRSLSSFSSCAPSSSGGVAVCTPGVGGAIGAGGAGSWCSSMPPPSLIMLVLAPPGPWIGDGEGTGLAPWMSDGLLKYSEIAPRCSSVVASISHIRRKNAIIAVAKSANATFQEPPWCAWPPFFTFLMMIGRGAAPSACLAAARPMTSGLLAQLRFQILEARPQRTRRRLASELDRDLRRLAAQEAHDAGLDGRVEMRLVARHALERVAHRTEQAVRQQNAEERTDERGRDFVADLGRRTAERAHRVHDAEHRGDDAEAGHRIGELAHRLRRLLAVVVMRFDLLVHQRFELVLVHVAADDQTQVVLDELDDVMVLEDQRALLEHFGLRR